MYLTDGYKTLITFAGAPSIKLQEIETTPPGVSIGNAIDTTTMRNTAWRTAAPAVLKKLSQVKSTCAYDPTDLANIQAQVGVNQLITVSYPNGSSISFYGFLDSFTPGTNTEGKRPDAAIVIEPTMVNASGVETAPTYVSGS